MIRIFSPSRDLPFERYFPKLTGVPYILPSEKEKKDFEYKLVRETEKVRSGTEDRWWRTFSRIASSVKQEAGILNWLRTRTRRKIGMDGARKLIYLSSRKKNENCSRLIDTSPFLPFCPPSNTRQAWWPIHCAVSRARWCILRDEQLGVCAQHRSAQHPLAIFHPIFLFPIE